MNVSESEVRVVSRRRNLILGAAVAVLAVAAFSLRFITAGAQSGALASADTALQNGDYDTAVTQYTAAVGDPSLKCDALYGVGVTQFRAKHYAEADAAFSQHVSECGAMFRTVFMRGEARQQLNRPQDALTDYQQALTLSPGLLDSYLYERMAPLEPDKAIYYLRLATEAAREPESKFSLRLKLAQVYLLIDSPASALTEYNTLLGEIDQYRATLSKIEGATYDEDGSLRADVELAAANIEIQNGQPDAGYARMQKIVTTYQKTDSALPTLIALVQAGQSVDTLDRTRINVYHQNYAPVVGLLADAINDPKTAATFPAEIYVLLGRAQRGNGDSNGAIATFARAAQLFPQDPMAATALLEQANTYAAAGDTANAVTAYTNLAAAYPNAPEAPQALLAAAKAEPDTARSLALYDQLGAQYPTSAQARSGLFNIGMALRTSNPAKASQYLGAAGTAESLVWQGKVLQQGGAPDSAQQAWLRAEAVDPLTFFSVRACELLSGTQPLATMPLAGMPGTPTDADKAAAAQWVAQTWGLSNVSADLSPELAADPMLKRGEALWAVGLWSDARAEFDTLHKLHRSDPVGLLQLAFHYADVGLTRSSLRAATRLMYAANKPFFSIPDSVLRLAYPLRFADLIVPQAQKNNLDPLLVAGLIRQESSFDPTVNSSANARGLMQFVPATAQDMADQLKWPNYTLDDLYRPMVSVAFGTHYLASMRDFQGGSNVGALLSYNAGPGAAQQWLNNAGGDVDVLYETVGYAETQLYLDIITVNHFMYQHLYTANAPTCGFDTAAPLIETPTPST